MNAKVFIVFEVFEANEPDSPVAICSSLDEAKKLFPHRLWCLIRYNENGYQWTDAITMQTLQVSRKYSRPTPYYEEVEMNTEFGILRSNKTIA